MIKDSFVWHFADIRLSRSAIPGAFTLFHWKRIFASAITRNVLVRPLLNSLSTSISISFFAMLIGSLLAWFVTRTNLPLRGFVATAAVLPYVIPSYIHALAWINLFKNERIGGAAGVFQFLSGVSPPDWLSYGFFPIVCTAFPALFPLYVSPRISLSIKYRLEA